MKEYRFYEWADGEICERCGNDIHSGWLIDGRKYGTTCGRIILKAAGVTWPGNYGPGSFDPIAMGRAIELNKWSRKTGWAYSHKERKAIKMVVGLVGWNMAANFALGKRIAIGNSEESWRCYQAAQKAWDARK